MTMTVEGPNGASIDFPDGTDKSTIHDVMTKHFGGASQAPSMAIGLARETAKGVPILGGLLNKLDAGTDAGLSYVMNPLFAEKDRLKGSFGDRYGQALKTQEGEDTAFEEQHPYLSTAANIAGGVSATGGAAATGIGAKVLGLGSKTTPLLGKIAMGAGSGAAIGAADEEIRGGSPGVGALIGGIAGAAGPAIGRGIGKLAEASGLSRLYEAAKTPETEAARQIAAARTKDAGKGLTPAQIQEAVTRDQPVTMMDTSGGRATQRLLRRAVNVSPEAQEISDSTIFGRFRDQNKRTAEWVQGLSEFGGDAHELDKAMTASMRARDTPAYAKAYAAGANGIWTNELAQASQAPTVQNAIRKTMVSAKNDAAKMGVPAPQNPFRTDGEGRIFLGKDSNGRQLVPSLQFWDYVKRNLDTAAKGGDRDAQEWARLIREHIDQTPGVGTLYSQARAGHAAFMGAKDALQAGRDAVTPGTAASRADNRVLRDNLNKMSPAERRIFREGTVDKMAQTLLGKPDSQNILNSINNSPAARERLLTILGQEKYNNLDSYLNVESFMDRFRTAMGNSTTARQLGDMEEGSVIPKSFRPTEIVMNMLTDAAKKMGSGIDERVATKIAEMLTSETGSEYAKAMRMIAGNKRLLGIIKIANEDIVPIATRGAASGANAARQRRPSVYVTDN